MSDIKWLKTLVAASIAGDVALTTIKFGDIHETVDHVVGYEVWSHEILTFAPLAKAGILEQYPDLAAEEGEDHIQQAERLLEKYGETIPFTKGKNVRDKSPMETMVEIAGDRPIIVVETDRSHE